MLYQAYQNQSDLMSPLRLLAQGASAAVWSSKAEGSWLRKYSASMEVFSRLRLTHSRPDYGITRVSVAGEELPVREEIIQTLPFGTLLRFRKEVPPDQVEGERDDICAVGQAVAAQDLCTSVRPWLRTHHVQTGVGHYSVFSGRKWNQQIYPRVREMIHASMG